jgi:hypothetical protein
MQIGGKSEKSNSISKNVVGNNMIGKQSLSNNQFGPSPNLLNSKQMNPLMGGSKQKVEDFDGNRYEQPMLNRYNSSNQGGIIGKQKDEPM